MPPIIILPLVLAQATAPPVVTMPPPAPVPMPVYRAPSPPPPPPASGPRAASPRGNPGSWVTSDDYPSRALRAEQEGRTGFRVIVGHDGRATHCEIRESSGWPTLDEATCRHVMRRARFNPALNRLGEAAEGSYSSAVRWAIPQDYDQIEVGTIGRSFVIETDGAITACREEEPVLGGPGYAQQCNAAEFFVPFGDRKGKPTRRQIVITTVTSMTDAD